MRPLATLIGRVEGKGANRRYNPPMVDIALLTEPTEGHSAGQHVVTVPAEEARGHEIGDLVRVTVTVQAYQEPEATPESPAAKA